MWIPIYLEPKVTQRSRNKLQSICRRQRLNAKRCPQLTKDAIISCGIFSPANIMQTGNNKLEVVLCLTLQVNKRLKRSICLVEAVKNFVSMGKNLF